MRARDRLLVVLVHVNPGPDTVTAADTLLDAYRAEVLREAAEVADARTESHTVSAVADVLRRMADDGPEVAR